MLTSDSHVGPGSLRTPSTHVHATRVGRCAVMIRAGPEVVTDPAFHVTRNMEDFITWVDSSKIKRKVMKYNDALDDFDLLQA
jgi:hypothetical protein